MAGEVAMHYKKGLSGYDLKLIAMVTMTMDHIALLWLGLYANSQGGYVSISFDNGLDSIYTIMRGVGRLAFPLYAFLLVEGFFHSHNRKKYALRLLLLALAAEIPFNFLDSTMWFDPLHNNVMWTLLLGLVAMSAIEWLYQQPGLNIILQKILIAVVALGAMVLSNILRTDYGEGGILCILLIYIFYGKSAGGRLFAPALGIIFLVYLSSAIEFAALFSLIPIYFYNGTRGQAGSVMKKISFLYYPLHLIILDAVALLYYLC